MSNTLMHPYRVMRWHFCRLVFHKGYSFSRLVRVIHEILRACLFYILNCFMAHYHWTRCTSLGCRLDLIGGGDDIDMDWANQVCDRCQLFCRIFFCSYHESIKKPWQGNMFDNISMDKMADFKWMLYTTSVSIVTLDNVQSKGVFNGL